ncbi:TNFAIP3-interacting protein 3-like [Echeneis naucrates]|uniref:TNFAIP3-interacting protein 3-like n=1 Tax=Echeneis naucrates TaxID=173247 RepID=UPI0011144137|nr:TNFAIP3-interacting protein 3-like [Echeneis naucrates]
MESLSENTMERVQAAETDLTDNKPTHRLYPSLPNIDRYDICLHDDKPAAFHPERLLEDTQLEVCAANSDVRMKAQILVMEEQRQELLSINEKWAREYRTMAQYYKEKVQHLKALLRQNHTFFEESEEEETPVTYNKLKFKTLQDEDSKRSDDADGRSKLLKLEKEAEDLRARNVTLTRRGQQQHEEIKRLNKALEEAHMTTQPLEMSSETLQDLWKHQAQIYKEDFLTERKDREKLKDKYLELENKFRRVRGELHVLKSQVNQPSQPLLECACTNQVKYLKWEVLPVNQRHMQLQRRCPLDNQR